jgi:hypothetical protein
MLHSFTVPIGCGKVGYTHYWYQSENFSQDEWEKIAMDTMKALDFCEKSGVEMTSDYDSPEKAEVNDDRIRFNGVGNLGHETFILEKDQDFGWSQNRELDEAFFNFCKTARKPYDLAVGLVLFIMKNHASNKIRVESDGDWDGDWDQIKQAYKTLFNSDPPCSW